MYFIATGFPDTAFHLASRSVSLEHAGMPGLVFGPVVPLSF